MSIFRALSLVCLLLAACSGAQPQQPSGYGAGRDPGEGRLAYGHVDDCAAQAPAPVVDCEIRFYGNPETGEDRLLQYLLSRAAEVGQQQNRRYFQFESPEYGWFSYQGRTAGRIATMRVQYLDDPSALPAEERTRSIYAVQAVYEAKKHDHAAPVPPGALVQTR